MATGTEEYYRARAREYDRVYGKPERQADLRRLRGWLAGALAGRRVLEVAAGTGWWTDAYADRAARVMATDVNEATLDIARSRRPWPPTVAFDRADAFDLTGVPAEFDAVLAAFFWSHVPLRRLDGFLAGVAAHLTRPGLARPGLAVFLDNRHVAGSNHPVSRTDPDGNTYQQRTLSDGSRWEVLKNFPSAGEISARLAPFSRAVRVAELDYYWRATAEFG